MSLLFMEGVDVKSCLIYRPEISSAWRKLVMDSTVKVPEPRRLTPEDGIWVEPGVRGVGFLSFVGVGFGKV